MNWPLEILPGAVEWSEVGAESLRLVVWSIVPEGLQYRLVRDRRAMTSIFDDRVAAVNHLQVSRVLETT